MRTAQHFSNRGPAYRARRLGALRIILVALVAVLLAGIAAAQVVDVRGRGHEGSGPQRVRGRQAPLVWLEGVLGQDRAGAWVLVDGTRLSLAPDLRWRDSETGREESPSAGRHVRLMGQRRHSVFWVRQATLISHRQVIERERPQSGPSREPTPADGPS